MDGQQRVQSVVVAHQVLDALSTQPDALSLAALARLLDMTPSRVLRHLTTLVDLRLVERAGAEPVYRLGSELLRLSERAAVQHDVSRIALPALRRLSDEFGQATFMARRDGNRALIWLSFASNDVPHLTMPPGMAFSLSGSACGRVLLAFNPGSGSDVPLVVGSNELHPDPMPDRSALHERLAHVRETFFDSYGTAQANAVYSLAAPILDHEERAVAALGIVGFSIYYAGRSEALVRALKESAASVSQQLGSRMAWPAASSIGAA